MAEQVPDPVDPVQRPVRDRVAAAPLHLPENGFIPSGVKHPVAPIAAILIENARHGVNINLQRGLIHV